MDVNRNFDFMWGDLSGDTSDDPCAATYHGPSPESESETQAVSIRIVFCESWDDA